MRVRGGLSVGALLAVYAALAIAPVALALLPGQHLGAPWREASSMIAMVAYAILLMEFVLSGRFRVTSRRAGIDAVMRFHQLAGRIVLLLLVLHPFLYAVPRLSSSLGDAWAMVERMFGSERLRSGVIAWFLLLVLVPMAIWRDRLPMRYEPWRLSHGLGAAVIAALGLHHTLQVGTHARGALLAGLWMAMAALVLASLAYVYLIGPFMQRRHPYRVVSNRQVADRMWQVVVEPERGPAMDFHAGQFAWVNFGHSPFSLVEHPFSISSTPDERPRVAFTIKEAGDFTRRIGSIAPGTRAYLDGPHGAFTALGRTTEPLAFIAGGIGFAPIIGILRDLRASHYPNPMRLVYGNRTESQILYREETAALAIPVEYVLSEPPPGWKGRTGELTQDVLAQCLDVSNRREWLYFVCGPAAMMDGVGRSLRALGVPARQIVTERFSYG